MGLFKRKGVTFPRTSWLYFFIGGFILGVIAISLFDQNEAFQSGFFNDYTLGRMQYVEINSTQLFWYVLKIRLRDVGILALLASTALGIVAVYCYTVWLGATVGILLSAMIVRFGLKGVLLFFSCILPHYLLYIPACILLLSWCYRLCVKMYFPHRDYDASYGSRRQQQLKQIVQLLLVLAVVITEAIVESYVNPILLGKVVKLFF